MITPCLLKMTAIWMVQAPNASYWESKITLMDMSRIEIAQEVLYTDKNGKFKTGSKVILMNSRVVEIVTDSPTEIMSKIRRYCK